VTNLHVIPTLYTICTAPQLLHTPTWHEKCTFIHIYVSLVRMTQGDCDCNSRTHHFIRSDPSKRRILFIRINDVTYTNACVSATMQWELRAEMFYFSHLLHRVAEKSPYLYLIYRVVLYAVCCVQCTTAYCVHIQVVTVLPDITL
jgi:hypothetical protein